MAYIPKVARPITHDGLIEMGFVFFNVDEPFYKCVQRYGDALCLCEKKPGIYVLVNTVLNEYDTENIECDVCEFSSLDQIISFYNIFLDINLIK